MTWAMSLETMSGSLLRIYYNKSKLLLTHEEKNDKNQLNTTKDEEIIIELWMLL